MRETIKPWARFRASRKIAECDGRTGTSFSAFLYFAIHASSASFWSIRAVAMSAAKSAMSPPHITWDCSRLITSSDGSGHPPQELVCRVMQQQNEVLKLQPKSGNIGLRVTSYSNSINARAAGAGVVTIRHQKSALEAVGNSNSSRG